MNHLFEDFLIGHRLIFADINNNTDAIKQFCAWGNVS
jgi:hypothetical protein